MKILYTAEVIVQGGRAGQARSLDSHLDVQLSMPIEMEGAGGPGTNPEQLFAAGYAACFQAALQWVARRQRVEVDTSTVMAKVGIGSTGEGEFGLAVELHIAIPGIEKATAEQLAELAHQVCPYSKATRGNIPVKLMVEEQSISASSCG